MTNIEARKSILAGPRGRAIDVNQAVAQIGIWIRARIGFHDLMYSTDYIKFRVSCPPSRKFWCIVKLAADDTFSVEFGRLRKFDWVIAAQVTGVDGAILGETVERLYQEVYF